MDLSPDPASSSQPAPHCVIHHPAPIKAADIKPAPFIADFAAVNGAN
jgi:hypothetical protein